MVLLKSDFSGEWVFFQHEGMDEFLGEIGVGWMMRKTAAFMDYGIGGGKTRQILTYDPDKNSLRVVMISPRGTKEVVAPLDGSVFTTLPPKQGKTCPPQVNGLRTRRAYLSIRYSRRMDWKLNAE